MPFSGESRPTDSTSGGSAGSPTGSGSSTAARDHAHLARAELARRLGERVRGADREPRAARARAPRQAAHPPRQLDVGPQSCTTNGLPVASATAPAGSQCACTRSASRAARRAACANEPSIAGTSAAFHGERCRLPITPAP